MSDLNPGTVRRVLIASANPLFAKGLEKMVTQRWAQRGVEIRLAASNEEATAALESWMPDLVIVDYDDIGRPGSIRRADFLSHFIAGDRPMQVMLVSLRESGEVVVYDRRTLTPAQAEDWLDLPWTPAAAAQPPDRSPAPEALAPVEPEKPQTQQSLRSGSMKHYVIAGALTVVLTVLSFLLLTNIGLLPVQASVQAGPIDQMVQLQLWMISFLFSLIVVFILYSVFVFRARKGDTQEGAYFKGSTRLEVLWTLFPLATVIYLSFLGAQALGDVRKADPQAMTINVIAFQWGWSFEYPDLGITSSTLYLPKDKQVKLMLTSRDVIHSFWVPEFRVKQDALPGENLVKELRLTANVEGEYTVMCAELCGGAHAYMNSPVRVVSQADFDAWAAEESNAADAPPAERGQRIANSTGCIGCHSLDGTQGAGPTWQGLYNAEIPLADGSTVVADDEYLHESIVAPNAKIHQGFGPIMPSYEGTLTEEQIRDVIEFIKTVQ